MQVETLLKRALNQEFLSAEEGEFLFHNASTTELMFVGNELKKQKKQHNKVTWIIDRNLNTTNVCIANCKFCNFYRIPGHDEAYITSIDEYKEKIEETIKYGGEQLLLQGGHHPDLGLKFYCDTFSEIKRMFPNVKLHALGAAAATHDWYSIPGRTAQEPRPRSRQNHWDSAGPPSNPADRQWNSPQSRSIEGPGRNRPGLGFWPR